MPRWEYWHGTIDAQDSRAESYPYQENSNYLTQLGEEGWELVQMTPDWVWGYNSIEQTPIGLENVGNPNLFLQYVQWKP